MVARKPVTPVSVTGRRYGRREKYTRRTLRRASIAGAVGIVAVLAYTIPFAGATQEGYAQNQLKRELQAISRENEFLRTEVERLKNPQQVEAYAKKTGMEMRQGARFVTLKPERKKVAPPKPLLARLSFFSFR